MRRKADPFEILKTAGSPVDTSRELVGEPLPFRTLADLDWLPVPQRLIEGKGKKLFPAVKLSPLRSFVVTSAKTAVVHGKIGDQTDIFEITQIEGRTKGLFPFLDRPAAKLSVSKHTYQPSLPRETIFIVPLHGSNFGMSEEQAQENFNTLQAMLNSSTPADADV